MIESGIAQIDELLNGGFRGGLVTDIFGSPASGKTQLVFQVCANAVAHGHTVLFLDTKGEFRPERILEMLGTKGGDGGLLERIRVLRITNTGEQISGLLRIRPCFSLVIIEGVTELFSFEFSREGQSLEKNKLFMKYMHDLSRISIEQDIPVIMTNTIRNIDGTGVESMERAISPFAHLKIRLTKDGDSIRGTATTVNRSSKLSLVITPEGISGAP